MPTYQYACTECGHSFEQVQAFTDSSLTECPDCSGRLRKLFNAVGVVFKGSGFYRNDSRTTPSEGGSSDSTSAEKKGSDGKGSDGKGSDGKGSSESTSSDSKKADSSASGSSTAGSNASSNGSGSASGTSTKSPQPTSN